jgi:hypothetical protein
MNTRFVKTLSLRAAMLAGCLTALTLGAQAQSLIARATVPFEFAAGGAMMPAGDYSVDVPVSGVLLLHGPAGNSVALFSTFSGTDTGSSKAKLLFAKHDGVPYLSAVEWPGETAQVMSVFKPITKPIVAAVLH